MNRLQQNSGLTLIEVILAVALASIGLLAYGVLSGAVIERNAVSKKSSVAVTLAQDKIEELKELGTRVILSDADALDSPVYDSSTQSWTATAGGEAIDSQGVSGGTDAIYTRTWSITPISGADYFTNVGVTVSWDNAGRSVSLNTYMTQ
ncbi:MAG: prepilin-type N-terminal cleavage/methylation domain-containing protein [Nitrospina sp.]|jgi:type IV pilus assembly protein PilV|nr:prepilin-type N-terminal cleavage/methylation domain-containing protein [Nitrospina sp.]